MLESHYFLCECSKCLDEKSDDLKNSLKCGADNCDGCVPIKAIETGIISLIVNIFKCFENKIPDQTTTILLHQAVVDW